MGYMAHHAIVVTGYDKRLDRVREKALSLGMSVSGVVASPVNGYRSFLVAPDGSKAGWKESEEGDKARETFVKWLKSKIDEDGYSPFDWVEVQYGDDELNTLIVHDSDEEARRRDRVTE